MTQPRETPIYGWPTPAPAAPDDVPEDMQDLAEAIEAAVSAQADDIDSLRSDVDEIKPGVWEYLGDFEPVDNSGTIQMLYSDVPGTSYARFRVEWTVKCLGTSASSPTDGTARMRMRISGHSDTSYRYQWWRALGDSRSDNASSQPFWQCGYNIDESSSDNFQGEGWAELHYSDVHNRLMANAEAWAQPGSIQSNWVWQQSSMRLIVSSPLPITSLLMYTHDGDSPGGFKVSATRIKLFGRPS